MHTEGLPFASSVVIELIYLRDKIIFRKEHKEVSWIVTVLFTLTLIYQKI